MKKLWIPLVVCATLFSASAQADRYVRVYDEDDGRTHRRVERVERVIIVREPVIVYQAPPAYERGTRYYRNDDYAPPRRVQRYSEPSYYDDPPPRRYYDQRWSDGESYRSPRYARDDDNRAVGQALGAIAGGVIGNRFGEGGGKAAATAVGAIIGGVVGGRLSE